LTAIADFRLVVGRSRQLLALRESLSPEQIEKTDQPDDLCRAAVAIAVAGMDVFFTDRFCESLVPFLKSRGATKPMVKLLEEARLDAAVALDLLTMERPFRRVRTLIEKHLSRHTTQLPAIIDKLFAPYGISNLSNDAAGLAKRKRLIRDVEKVVQRRHVIVHEADVVSNRKLGKLPVAEARNFVTHVERYVEHCEILIAKVLNGNKKKVKRKKGSKTVAKPKKQSHS
jgi:hypothetical protein